MPSEAFRAWMERRACTLDRAPEAVGLFRRTIERKRDEFLRQFRIRYCGDPPSVPQPSHETSVDLGIPET